ncbi:FxsA family protein [Amycolatopsis aidingensis]|uniref:FxsA family protein n=1 Tax=Amycolatopsis aidingensis TaxID=2842453 RepID=UPI001C0C7C5F|nr:FxsA family protein [Amycolatopsis aidingensis]
MAVVLLLYLVAEIAAVWAVASVIGLLGTLGLLLAGAFIGSALARREGGRAAQAFLAAAGAGRPAHAELTDGMLVAFGGVLILLPGFVSDLAGLLLLLPPTRGVFRRAWVRRLERRAQAMGPMRGQGRVIVVDGEVVDGHPPDRQDRQAQPPTRPIIDSQ